MENKTQIAQTILLNKFVLTLLVLMLILALSSGLGIAEVANSPATPL